MSYAQGDGQKMSKYLQSELKADRLDAEAAQFHGHFISSLQALANII